MPEKRQGVGCIGGWFFTWASSKLPEIDLFPYSWRKIDGFPSSAKKTYGSILPKGEINVS